MKLKEVRKKNQTVLAVRLRALLRNSFFYGLLLASCVEAGFADERIVSLNACTDELLLQLVPPEQIAGVTQFSHSPSSRRALTENPAIKKLPPQIEALLHAAPTVVLAGPFSNRLLVEELQRLHVPVVSVDVPRNWDELIQAASQIASVTGQTAKLEMLRKKIEALEQRRSPSQWAGKSAVFWSAAGHVSGRGTFENTILETLGMVNAVEREGYAFMPLEQLIALKPQVILVTQNLRSKNSWSHDTLFHPSLKTALPELEYLEIPEEASSCASGYTVEVLENLLEGSVPSGAARD